MTQIQLIKYENPEFTTGTKTLTLDCLLGHLWGSGQTLQGKTAAKAPHTPPLHMGFCMWIQKILLMGQYVEHTMYPKHVIVEH